MMILVMSEGRFQVGVCREFLLIGGQIDMPTPDPSHATSIAELDYEARWLRFRPLLLRCLAKLAGQGWMVQPSDGMVLIEDFLLDEWFGIAQRYDSAKGSAEAYVAGAFVRYARRAISRLHRWSMALRDSARLADELSMVRDEEAFFPADQAVVARAVATLPTELKRSLAAYLSASGKNEREIARKLQVTRYRLRTNVADAFGRVTVAIGAIDELPPQDQELARLLWRDGLTVTRAARHLKISASEVQNMRNQMLDRLRRGIS